MTEHTNREPLWFGMDVDAELARYREEDRRRAEAEAVRATGPERSSRRLGLRAAFPLSGRGGVPQVPLTA